jgi:uncharacterized protein
VRQTLACPYLRKAFGWCIPIGGLAGLIGLGGGEFRLPLLIYGLRFEAKSAVPLNLMVSLVTLAFSMIVRSRTVSIEAMIPHLPEIVGLAAGGTASAFYGARLVHALSAQRLVHLIAALLAMIGGLLLIEAIAPFHHLEIVAAGTAVHMLVGAAFGLVIGMVSSVLGVAGGELLIPTLIFVFGMDIKVAGSASILISLSVVLNGILRYRRMGLIPQGRGVQRLTLAMSLGSIIGATAGGLAIAYAPTALLKAFLGILLIVAAGKTIAGDR